MATRTIPNLLATVIAALVLVFASGGAEAKAKKSKSAAARRHINDKGSKKLCSKVKGKKRCKRVRVFQGHGVARSELRDAPLERPSGNLTVMAENLGEAVEVNIYREDGAFNEESLAKLDEVFRCKRTDEVRAVNPKLYEQLSRIQDHFEGKRVELVSGFRYAERNSSRHFHASAMDIRVQGVSPKEVYAYAQSLDMGGMGIGIYPNSGFVHVDFRAPGEPSYRWTDLSGGSSGKRKGKGKGKANVGRSKPARKPVS